MTEIPDEYLEAHRRLAAERFRAQTAWRARLEYPEYYQLEEDWPGIDWRETDPHLTAAKSRLRTSPNHELAEALRFDEDDPRRVEWLEERNRARREVAVLEKVGMDVPAELRAKSESADLFYDAEKLRTAMIESRQNAWARIR